jgi:Mg2+ and Co2+ transporter CorA
MRQAKASGDFTSDTFDKFMKKQEQEIDEAENDIFKEKGISGEIVQKLLAIYKEDPEIKDKLAELERIHKTVFAGFENDGKISHIPCTDMPDGLTEDTYILVYRKQ